MSSADRRRPRFAVAAAGWRAVLVARRGAPRDHGRRRLARRRALAGERRFAASAAAALAVAFVYDLARAVSLLVRAPIANARPQAWWRNDADSSPRAAQCPGHRRRAGEDDSARRGPHGSAPVRGHRLLPARRRDPVFSIDNRAAGLPVDYVEMIERHSFDPAIWRQLRRSSATADRHRARPRVQDQRARAAAAARRRRGGDVHVARLDRPLEARAVALLPVRQGRARTFTRVVAVSEDIRQQLLKRGAHPTRVRTVLNGIDHRAFRRDRSSAPEVRAALGLAADDIVVGSVGRLEHRSASTCCIEAVNTLRRRPPTQAGDRRRRLAARRSWLPTSIASGCRASACCPAIATMSPGCTTPSTCTSSRRTTRARRMPCSRRWRWRLPSWRRRRRHGAADPSRARRADRARRRPAGDHRRDRARHRQPGRRGRAGPPTRAAASKRICRSIPAWRR